MKRMRLSILYAFLLAGRLAKYEKLLKNVENKGF